MFDLSGLTTEPAPSEKFSPSSKMAFFDIRVRMPLDWLVESVRTETGERYRILTCRCDTTLVGRGRISQPRTTSLPCPAGLRARRPSPMMDLYRKNAFSTRP